MKWGSDAMLWVRWTAVFIGIQQPCKLHNTDQTSVCRRNCILLFNSELPVHLHYNPAFKKYGYLGAAAIGFHTRTRKYVRTADAWNCTSISLWACLMQVENSNYSNPVIGKSIICEPLLCEGYFIPPCKSVTSLKKVLIKSNSWIVCKPSQGSCNGVYHRLHNSNYLLFPLNSYILSAGSSPDGFIGIFHWHNPSERTMGLESNQSLTEMSIRRISWG
jgi:hypothetical protein